MQLHFLQHLVLVQPALVHKELQHAGLTSKDGSVGCSVEPGRDATLNIALGRLSGHPALGKLDILTPTVLA